jgi:chromosome segregation ATPase
MSVRIDPQELEAIFDSDPVIKEHIAKMEEEKQRRRAHIAEVKVKCEEIRKEVSALQRKRSEITYEITKKLSQIHKLKKRATYKGQALIRYTSAIHARRYILRKRHIAKLKRRFAEEALQQLRVSAAVPPPVNANTHPNTTQSYDAQEKQEGNLDGHV